MHCFLFAFLCSSFRSSVIGSDFSFQALAEQVTKENMAEGRVYPPLDTIRKVSLTIAAKVARFLFQEGLATYKPEPPDLETFLATKQYSYDYEA